MSRALPALAVIGAIVLSACGPGVADPGGPGTQTPGQTPSSSTPTGNDPQADMRTRLANGLRAANPTGAELVADPATTLTAVPTSWLRGWQVLDVANNAGSHPRRLYVALADDGSALRLSGQPDAFTTMVQQAGVEVEAGKTAVAVANTYLDVTRDFQQYSYQVTAVADIQYKRTLNETEQRRRTEVEKTYGAAIRDRTARQDGTDWAVTAWTVSGRQLVQHSLRVSSGGAVSDTTAVKVSDLPVPVSI